MVVLSVNDTMQTGKTYRNIIRVGLVVILFFLLLAGASKKASAEPSERVLFISSYHPGFPTFFQQIEGIKSTFSTQSIVLDIEFLDSKRFYDKTNLSNFHDSLSYKLSGIPAYDLILTADDNALTFAIKHQEELFAGLPIIFFGVNNIDTALEQNGNPKVTGVVEAVSMLDTLRLIRRLHPDTKNITALVDGAPSGQGDLKTFYRLGAKLDNIDLGEISLLDLSFDEFADQLRLTPENTNILLLSAYRDKNGKSLLFDSSLQLIRNNLPRPIYHLWLHGIGEGVLGGKLINHFDQGATAAKIALEVLNGRPVEDIAVRTKSPNRYIFDYPEMKRFGIGKGDLPEKSTIVNMPYSFYETNKKVVWAIIIVFSTLTALIIALSLNVIRRQRAEKDLLFVKFAVDHSADPALWIGKNGHFEYVNKASCLKLGYSREELLTLSVHDIDSNFKPETWPAHWEKVKTEGSLMFDSQHHTKNGDSFPVEITSNFMKFENKEYHCTFVRDISDRKKAEEESVRMREKLQQAQKMEAIGTLAGGVAHDFNNILSAILGYADLAIDDKNDHELLKKDIAEVRKAADRATSLVRQILTFSRKTEQQEHALQVSLVVKEALKLIRASIPSTIDIKIDINTDALVIADPTQIHQIVMNLCTNAYHAMRETGGVLSVRLNEVELSNTGMIPEVELPPGKYMQLSVGDTGTGMDDVSKTKIFEPYFTTKEVGEGTGLGLAVVHGVVESHGGCINVYSEPGQGTFFHIYLPIYEGEKDASPLPGEQKAPIIGGNETIMLVDDEEPILDMARKQLQRRGYEVHVFTNGVQAFQEFQQQPQNYDLIITDMTMPHMTGTQLSQRILETRPDIPIILCTGYSELTNREKSLAMGIKEYIEKPLKIDSLLRVVRMVLDS